MNANRQQPMTQDEYLKAGSRCPWCGSHEYDCPDNEYDYDGGYCDFVCLDCRNGCSYMLMLRGERGAAILVNVSPELLPAAWGESQPAYRQHGKSSFVLPTRTRFA